jgi:uncharacterized RDD family membrane protein YckC
LLGFINAVSGFIRFSCLFHKRKTRWLVLSAGTLPTGAKTVCN